jgi:hypothetical protein
MLAWMQADLAKRPVDRLIGFNKMPGLDVYYAADGCFEDKAQNLRHSMYRYFKRYRHFAEYERAVFDKHAKTDILMISEVQQPLFIKHYGTPIERFHLLPPGLRWIAVRRRMRLTFGRISGVSSSWQTMICCWCRSVLASRPKAWIAALKRWRPCPRTLKNAPACLSSVRTTPKSFNCKVPRWGWASTCSS